MGLIDPLENLKVFLSKIAQKLISSYQIVIIVFATVFLLLILGLRILFGA